MPLFVGASESYDTDAWEAYNLKKENAKLRELAQDMFGAYNGAVEMLPSSCTKNAMKRAVMDISDRMRELGIEVEA